ncbi:MAG: hypothetical protein ACTSRW_10235 [Candidatus Helarchaeota archaeon]
MVKRRVIIKEDVPEIYDLLYKRLLNRKISFNAITFLTNSFQYTLKAPFDLKRNGRKELFVSNDDADLNVMRKEALNLYLKFR